MKKKSINRPLNFYLTAAVSLFFYCHDSWSCEDRGTGKSRILLEEAKNMEVNYALNNTFGFGGHTASSISKKYPD
jgi:hypothetical protein